MPYLFETERLRARPFRAEDAERLYQIHAEAQVRQWIPNESYRDTEEAEEAILFFADRVSRGSLPYVLAVESKSTGELVGDIGVNEVEGQPDELEIGYVICEQAAGMGFATELARAMAEFAEAKFGVRALYGRVMRGNAASVRVLEKIGCAFVKEEFGAQDDPYGNGMLIYRKDCVPPA